MRIAQGSPNIFVAHLSLPGSCALHPPRLKRPGSFVEEKFRWLALATCCQRALSKVGWVVPHAQKTIAIGRCSFRVRVHPTDILIHNKQSLQTIMRYRRARAKGNKAGHCWVNLAR
ncbi:MAG: hypothetical protein QMD09_15115 [Desulfatibacillaceae bacterium]|nr:hypothetical protein [Desulfatibacillaceae bacterium]